MQNDTVDKVWLFDCPAKELNPGLDFTIVSVLNDEFTRQEAAVAIGVRVQLRSHFDKDFTECLKKENCTMKTKSEPHTESLSASTAQSEQIGGTETADDSFWELDVRKLCLILLTASFQYLLCFHPTLLHSHHGKVAKGLDCQYRTFK